MTVEVKELWVQLRTLADDAARTALAELDRGDAVEGAFHTGRQAAFVTALGLLALAEDKRAGEMDAETARNLDEGVRDRLNTRSPW